MQNPICEHCKYARFTCWLFKCDVYYEAKLKHAERKWQKQWYSGILIDYKGQDRYIAGMMFFGTIIALIVLFMILSSIRTFKDWLH